MEEEQWIDDDIEEEYEEDYDMDIEDLINDNGDLPSIYNAKDVHGNLISVKSRVKVINTDNSRPYTVTEEMHDIFTSGKICRVSGISDETHIMFEGWTWHPKDVEVLLKPPGYKKPKPVTFDTNTLDV